MIVYRELSSLEKDLSVSAKSLYALSNRIHKHYRTVKIPKGNGGYRTLSIPDKQLKAVQEKIARNILAYEEISPYATAYRFGGSTLKNANPHVSQPVVMKLDIRGFFDHCIFPVVKSTAFPAERYSEANRILLTLLCIYKDALPQGAPTSPVISNIVLRDFDNSVGQWCRERHIHYTRYCDDMTFSGDFDPREIKSMVKSQLLIKGFYLNEDKTTVLRSGQRKEVTGIVVNEKVSVPAPYRRKLRQELYYCRKFGVEDHLKKSGIDIAPEHYIAGLLGKVNYVLSIQPDNEEFLGYKRWLNSQIIK